MGLILSNSDRAFLKDRITESEKQTRAQIVLATVKRSDSYPELPWKAFAFGASVAGFTLFLLDLLFLRWVSDAMILFSFAGILVTGAFFALLTILIPSFARLFLSVHRKETETRQYAESLFLSHEVFASEDRNGILLFVSQFERQVVIFPDKGIRNDFSLKVMKNIISKMKLALQRKELKNAMNTGLEEIVATLTPPVSACRDKNELSNEIIMEGGA